MLTLLDLFGVNFLLWPFYNKIIKKKKQLKQWQTFQHDSQGDITCAPGGDAGNFIMFPMATSGFLPNNKLFSSCSITSMGSILETKARSSSGCFTGNFDSVLNFVSFTQIWFLKWFNR